MAILPACGSHSQSVTGTVALGCGSVGLSCPNFTYDVTAGQKGENPFLVRPADGVSCVGDGSYADLRDGAQVVLHDQGGTTIATGLLHKGTVRQETCEMSFALAHVPTTKFYKVVVGAQEGPTYSRSELQSKGWRVDLQIG